MRAKWSKYEKIDYKLISFRDDEYCATTTSKMKIKVAKDDNMIRKKKTRNMEGFHAYDHVVAKMEVCIAENKKHIGYGL